MPTSQALTPTDEKLEKLTDELEKAVVGCISDESIRSNLGWMHDERWNAARAALRERFEEAREQSHRLAMLVLQSDRYVQDAEYREAADAILTWSFPLRRASMKEQE